MSKKNRKKGKSTPKGNVYSTNVYPARRVLKIRKAQIFAGGIDCVDTGADTPWDLVISLHSDFRNKKLLTFLHGAEELINPEKVELNLPKTPTMKIDWPDGSAPWKLKRDFWIALLEAISNIDGDILIHCFGGHGRTGTALAALVGVMGEVGLEMPYDVPCVVEWVRRWYNVDAVESAAQIRYLENCLELPVSNAVKKSFISSSPLRSAAWYENF